MQVIKEVGVETSGDKDEVWLELVETREDLDSESFSPSI
jgi:hypothetical protein